MQFVVGKAEVRNPSFQSELVDLHANYDSNKAYLTNIGGFFQQLYYVVSTVLEGYP